MTEDDIQTKLAVLAENLERMAEIPQSTYEEFGADFRNLDSALHRLQTSIQALIDLASLATARRGLGAPRSSVDALQKLEDAGVLPPATTSRFTPMVGFRNRLVHLYDRIDPAIVYRVLTERRDDLVELARLLTDAVDVRTSS
jgi:uncharacterized protein YutE (UPF0331/DUF86 family)